MHAPWIIIANILSYIIKSPSLTPNAHLLRGCWMKWSFYLPAPSSNCKMFCVHFCAKPSVPAANAIARNTPPPAEGTWNTLSSTANTSLSSHNTPPGKEKPGGPSSWWTRFSSRKGPGVSSEVMKVEEERSLSACVDPCVSKRL